MARTEILVVTTDGVPGRSIVETLGLVVGVSVRSAHLGNDVAAMMQDVVGGEMHEYTKVLAETREQALDRLRDQARAKGADAVVGLRFTTSEIAAHGAELFAYGTAVRFEPEEEAP
jgi:uncharacterized protein YbjQ (UPF0145 family)